MNNFFQRQLLLIFLGSSLLILPACGSKNSVKTEKAPETVLNSDSSGSADIGMPEGRTPINTYTEKIKKSHPKTYSALNAKTPQAATPVVTTQTTPDNTPAMETATPIKKSGGSSWLWWILLICALGGAGYYFYSKHQAGNDASGQPKPPVGGLSPVSGFTAVKDKIEDDSQEEKSFWSKKLF